VVWARDPAGVGASRSRLEDVQFETNACASPIGADALRRLTEWDAVRAVDLDKVIDLRKEPVVDLRIMCWPAELRDRAPCPCRRGRTPALQAHRAARTRQTRSPRAARRGYRNVADLIATSVRFLADNFFMM